MSKRRKRVTRWQRLFPGMRLLMFGVFYYEEIRRAYARKRIK
jgi:hypothetical protein